MEKERRAGMTAAVGAVTFLMGIFVGMVWNGYGQGRENAEVPESESETVVQSEVMTPERLAAEGYLTAEAIRVRVEDGQVQWYDGRLWNHVASVEELEQQDRFSLSGEAFEAFEEEMRQERAAGRQKIISQDEDAVLVGQKETQRPATRPNTAAAAPQEPEESTPEAGGGADYSQPAGGGSSNPPPAEATPPADTGTSGDGENMEWSDDYL